ncbi:Histone-lysine N-methyltransferase NSD2 [Aphelenchoides besseyi]|nr:Histone-lysine N-methyltransferase NSD2 [Aphelenchoides besseyi]
MSSTAIRSEITSTPNFQFNRIDYFAHTISPLLFRSLRSSVELMPERVMPFRECRRQDNKLTLETIVKQKKSKLESRIKERKRTISDDVFSDFEKKKKVEMPSPFHEIDVCILRCRKSDIQCEDVDPSCSCTIDDEKPCASASQCLNKAMLVECQDCPSGENCQNSRFQRRQYSATEVRPSGAKGFGLFAVERIRKGSLIIEFLGEIIDHKEFFRRIKIYEKSNDVQHHYLMCLESRAYIDATKFGNKGRFINHSCSPNATTQQWIIKDRVLTTRNSKTDNKECVTSTCIGFFCVERHRS